MLLGDLGAEIIKVENPGNFFETVIFLFYEIIFSKNLIVLSDIVFHLFIDGGDETRNWGPPFINNQSVYFLSVNRNKKVC